MLRAELAPQEITCDTDVTVSPSFPPDLSHPHLQYLYISGLCQTVLSHRSGCPSYTNKYHTACYLELYNKPWYVVGQCPSLVLLQGPQLFSKLCPS